jgi:hypothetical protein
MSSLKAFFENYIHWPCVISHTYNSNYSGDRDQGIVVWLKFAQNVNETLI